ncbi:MATE family efflux transporter [Paenibacillus glucanolyticus]|uniref:MATE family efflux transporter n=1 Tax=Paenibacillus glucanolyticus TaxID=59843 RepID=UPI00096DCE80|nr:MATE family efflux transporter [Paenibacillus glucanolyticus]OMF80149.1 multidrug efflux MATE transporter FepA [Paenibacillus glucanolyticus]
MSTTEQQKQNILDTQSTGKVFLRYLIPSLVGMVLMAVNIVVDGIMVGNKLGAAALAGVNISGPVYTIFVAMSILIGIGGATLYSQSMGARNPDRARFIFTHSVTLILLFTIVVGGIAFLFHGQLVYLLGANAETAPFASDYMNVFLALGFIFTLENALSIFIRNDGNPTLAMLALIVTAVSNVIFNFVILYVLELGIREIAFGTIAAAFLGLLVLGTHFFKKSSNLKLQKFRFDKKLFILTLTFGFPSFLAELGISVFTIAHNIVFSRLAGTEGVAAFSIVNYVHGIMLLLFLGMGSAIQPLVSYYHGGQKHDRKRETVRIATWTAIGTGAAFTMIGQIAAAPIVNIFGDFSADIQNMATSGIRIFFIAYLVMGINFIMMTYFQSIGKVKMAAWITAGREIFFLLIFLSILPALFGIQAAWLAVPISEFVMLITIIIYVKRQGHYFSKQGTIL